MRFSALSTLFVYTALIAVNAPARAESAQAAALPRAELVNLARDFVARMNTGLAKADKALENRERQGIAGTDYDVRGLPDGEPLILKGVLPDQIVLENQFVGRVDKSRALISLRDFTSNLEFPIEYAEDMSSGTGWYIRENNPFSMNSVDRTVKTAEGTFDMSADVSVEDNDIFVPIDEVGSWFGIHTTLDISSLVLNIKPSTPLPIQEKKARHKRKFGKTIAARPVLPRGDDERQMVDVPMADVYSTVLYNRPGDGRKSTTKYSTNIRTTGDLAKGTLTTQTQLNNEDNLSTFRANYKQESADPDLLGPLKARRYEVGDLLPATVPLLDNASQELGVRVTNVDPLRVYTRPTTQITGPAPPGWDVELYRETQLLDLQTVSDEGIYLFNDVALYQNDNNFRVVMYGPQGEKQEENVYIPVDPGRLSNSGGVYDVSLSLNDRQTYNKNDFSEDEDKGSPRLSALYETPVGTGGSVSAGFRTQEEGGDRRYYGQAGYSTGFAGFLLNLDAAADDRGEMASEFVARRTVNTHDFRNSARWQTEGYQIPDDELATVSSREIFKNTTNLSGPMPVLFGARPRYNLGFEYGLDSDGDNRYTGSAGLHTSVKRVSLGQTVNYTHTDKSADDNMHAVTTAAGTLGRHRIRLTSDYEIKPDSSMDRLAASWLYRHSKDLNTEVDLEKRFSDSSVEGTLQVNWMAGFARISPSVSYNNDGDVTARLNTNFGMAYDPGKKTVRMFDRTVTGGGALSAFVYLDKDGNNIFSDGDEALPDIVVKSLQTGGRATTDEEGYAYIQSMASLRLTDVVVDANSLPDPFWVPGYKGASILPREGFVAEMQFPIHVAGEMDGTLFVQNDTGRKTPLRDVSLQLYDADGTPVQETKTAGDGFYLFERIPPGDYLLMVDADDAARYKLQSPDPQPIHIGYEGTVIYGNDIVVQGDAAAVPVGFVAGIKDYLAANPQVDPATLADSTVILNMGSYRSQLLMGLVWYKLRTRYGGLLADAELLVPPSESTAAPDTGRHELLLHVPGLGVADAMRRCRMLAARGVTCGVELIPPGAQPERVATAGG